MTTYDLAGAGGSGNGLLDKARTIAKPGFNRWVVPPAALAIHLCIGMAYGFSVFWVPLGRMLAAASGAAKPIACPGDPSTFWGKVGITGHALFATDCDWTQFDLGWMFTLFFVVLGSSAAIWGGWLEREGPRKAAFVAALCWCGGLVISAFGVYVHQLWVLWLGSGVIGGIGLGLGYISPVSTLVKWFPARRGMAAVYFVFMVGGAFAYRLPPPGWRPDGWTPPTGANLMIARGNVHLKDAHKTPQFWLIWIVLCMNVSAGIGVIGAASPMLQDAFGGRLFGDASIGFAQFTDEHRKLAGAVATGFVGLFSLFNIAGRFFWASLSDRLGRKQTYFVFFILGILCYGALTTLANLSLLGLFAAVVCIIASMYGGGFATVPAYLADMFGTQYVGAIHGRLLTAWSTAGIVGPVLVNYLHDSRVADGVPRDHVYDSIFYALVGLLVIGLIANALVRPVAAKWFMPEEATPTTASGAPAASGSFGIGYGGLDGPAIVAWLAVGLPLAWGIYMTLLSAVKIFQ